VIQFWTFGVMEDFFNKLVDTEVIPPELSLKYSSSSELALQIKSKIPYEKYEIYGSREGDVKQELMQKTKNNFLELKNLKPNSKYYLKIRGKKLNSNIWSVFSLKEFRTTPSKVKSPLS